MNTKTILIAIAIIVALFAIWKIFFSNRVPAEALLTPDEFESKMKEQGIVLLDVRSAFEFGGDKIKGAKNISYTGGDFKGIVDKMDRNTTYLVYFLVGSRSEGALNTMKAMGFANVYTLKGGIENWKSSGKPVIK
jgi:rhodanese-related sulfurtransferase